MTADRGIPIGTRKMRAIRTKAGGRRAIYVFARSARATARSRVEGEVCVRRLALSRESFQIRPAIIIPPREVN